MDSQHIAETYHQVDPATGFIETTGNYATAFTPERKQQFLSVYVASGLRFKHTCKQLGLSDHTINHHITIDPEFKKAVEECHAEYAEELEARQRNFALEPKHFMDRAMQLRCLLPGKYARDENRSTNQNNITININAEALAREKERANAIEAEIIKEIAGTLDSKREVVENQRV